MKKAFAVFKTGLKSSLQYRFHFFVSLLVAPLSLVIYYFLWKSIYSYSGEGIIRGFAFNELMSYFIINLIIGMLVYSFIDGWMSEDVIDGEISLVFLKPMSFFSWWFSVDQGTRFMSLFIEAIPLFLIAVLFFGLKIYSISTFVMFIVSTVLASIIVFLMAYNLGICSFWLKRISGLRRLRKSLTAFFGGGLIPLTFFPLAFQSVSYWLPFQYTRYVPIGIFLGRFRGIEALSLMIVQLVWIVLFYLLSLFILSKAVKKFAGEGI